MGMIMIKRKKTPTNEFYTMFIGELVEVTLTLSESAQRETDDGIEMYTGPIKVEGYFLDVFEDHYILGDDPNQASRIVQKDKVVSINIIKDNTLENVYDGILDSMTSKPSKHEIN